MIRNDEKGSNFSSLRSRLRYLEFGGLMWAQLPIQDDTFQTFRNMQFDILDLYSFSFCTLEFGHWLISSAHHTRHIGQVNHTLGAGSIERIWRVAKFEGLICAMWRESSNDYIYFQQEKKPMCNRPMPSWMIKARLRISLALPKGSSGTSLSQRYLHTLWR